MPVILIVVCNITVLVIADILTPDADPDGKPGTNRKLALAKL